MASCRKTRCTSGFLCFISTPCFTTTSTNQPAASSTEQLQAGHIFTTNTNIRSMKPVTRCLALKRVCTNPKQITDTRKYFYSKYLPNCNIKSALYPLPTGWFPSRNPLCQNTLRAGTGRGKFHTKDKSMHFNTRVVSARWWRQNPSINQKTKLGGFNQLIRITD